MKKFILKTIGFLAILFSLFLISLLLPNREMNAYKLSKDITTVFIGDSRVQLAIQDQLLKNAKNIAIPSESTFYSYYKIRKLVEENPKIKKVYLGFSHHSISSYYEKFIFGKHSKRILPRYFDLLKFEEKQIIIPSNFLVFYKNYLKIKLKGTHSGYMNVSTKTIASEETMTKRINGQFYDEEGELLGFSKINIEYLEKIKNLLFEKNVELVLIDIPLHPYYEKLIPQTFRQKYDSLLEEHQLTRLGFNEIVFSDDCFLPDGDHLSIKGATKLSTLLVDNI